MQAALYDPELGYYNTARLKIGAAGDYYTSSNLHPAFGAVLARAFAELWKNQPGPLTVVEMGAGTGQLAIDVLSAMRDEHDQLFASLNYVIVETSPAMLARQRDKLADVSGNVQWRGLEVLGRDPISGIIFSNEFVDATPVHVVRQDHGEIEELCVTVSQGEAGRLSFVWSKASKAEHFSRYIERMGASLEEGQSVEINLDAIDWLAGIERALVRGFLVTIDYGDLAEHLWSPSRPRGTLRSFYRHRLIDSPLERPGEQDITASVNFSALMRYGSDFGFDVVSFERQATFLTRFGLIERLAGLYQNSASLDDLNERLAVKNLFVPGGISDAFRVLIQRRQGVRQTSVCRQDTTS